MPFITSFHPGRSWYYISEKDENRSKSTESDKGERVSLSACGYLFVIM